MYYSDYSHYAVAPPVGGGSEFSSYDPQVFDRYYRRHPWQVIGRLIQIIWLLGKFWLRLQWDQLTGQAEAKRPQQAIQLRQTLTRLGPTFIKVGQALSTRPDLVRPDFLDELILLQDQLPPFANAEAFAIITAELGAPPESLYAEISEHPVAAASLGQVYRGRLKTGEEVAIKVQRPRLIPQLSLDLYIIRQLVQILRSWLPITLGHDLTLIVDEFGTKLFEEIDYLNEGRNAEQFAHNFQHNPAIKVPCIYWRYSTKRVLTLEWIQGYKLSSSQCALDAQVNPDHLIRIGVISGLQQLLEFGFFHADPHPGNLFALADGRMAYIDFGMMDQLDQETKETLVDALVHLVNRDYQGLAQDFVRLGFLTPETDIMPIVPALEAAFSDMVGASVGEFNFKTITDRFSQLMYAYPFRVPAKFALIIRSLVTQEGVALCLNPNFKIVEVSYPYIAQRLLAGETPDFRRRLLEVLFKDGKFQWQRLENLITMARSDAQFQFGPTAQLGLQFLFSEEGRFLRQRLILALTEDDRLHTEEVQRLWNLIKDDLRPRQLVDMGLGALAEFAEATVARLAPVTSYGSR